MSKNQSDLSNPHYGYDMVLATTQASVNATMEEWLSKYTGSPFIQAYAYNPNHSSGQTGISPIDFDQLKREMGFDPFSIPNNTSTDDPRIKKLQEQKFMFAFQIEIGIPTHFPLSAIPPVISFNKEGAYVTYNMVCKTFKIIAIEPALYGQTSWLNLSQDDSDIPWVFSYTVDLNLQSDNINNHFHKLPPATQKQIKNLGENMFSVQQLFLDLNTAGLTNNVKIEGLKATSETYIILTQVFLDTYMKQLSKNGGVMLGYSVTSKKPFPQNVSLIPTDLNFEICSYKDSKGKSTPDYDAYTLNYLIMSKGNPMPAPAQFSWNWVNKSNVSKYAGVMAINKQAFVNFLRNLLSPSLNTISKKPTTHFHINCDKASIKWGMKSDASPHRYLAVQNGGSHGLSYSYSQSSSDSSKKYCGIYYTKGNLGLKYTVQSDVYIQGTSITVSTLLNMHVHLNVEGGVAAGNFARKKATTTYTLGVDAQGALSVTQSPISIEDHSQKVKTGAWAKFITLGELKKTVNEIKDSLQGWLSNYLTQEADQITRMLNGSNGWTFPGGKTFTFQNAEFSDNQDLVANVIYITPTNINRIAESEAEATN